MTEKKPMPKEELAALGDDVLYNLVRNEATSRQIRDTGAKLLLERLPPGHKKDVIAQVAAHEALTPHPVHHPDGTVTYGRGVPCPGFPPLGTPPPIVTPLYREPDWAAKFNDVSKALAEAFDQLHARADDLTLKSVAVSSEVGAVASELEATRAELKNLRYEFEVAREKVNARIAKIERLWIVRVFAWLSSLISR